VGARLTFKIFGKVCPLCSIEVSREMTVAGRMKRQPSELQMQLSFKIKKLVLFKEDRTFWNIDLKSISKMTNFRARSLTS